MSKRLSHLSKKIFTAAFISVLIISCNNAGQSNNEVTIDDINVDAGIFDEISTAKQIFYTLPSPLETAQLLKSAGAEYNEQLLNPIDNSDNYTTNKKMALNLGIYTTDLSYASLFEQNQTSINYMETSKKMAKGLGVMDVIDEEKMKQLQIYLDNNNKTALMDIISETFMNSSAYLKDNNRPQVATIVLIGGWIEGLYIATSLVNSKDVKNNKLVDRIVEQKLSYDILVKLLEEYKNDGDIKDLKTQLQTLDGIMKKITIVSSETETETTEGSKQTLIKSTNKVTISPETFEALGKEVKALRNDFIL